ncbi:LysR substrate-binding domain-containing protein [Pseudomonas sp. JAI120]|uniref:LysR substrate-binding domain-containing protein n=1 Tax=Pseudomonas sp. JAI120 TaxID=2723063 RepID=UPI0030DB82D4
MNEALVIVAGPGHPLARQAKVEWEETVNYPWIVPNSGSPTREALEAMLAQNGLKLPGGVVDSISTTTFCIVTGTKQICLPAS